MFIRRFLSLVHYILLSFHWNACFFHLVHRNSGFGGAPPGAVGVVAEAADADTPWGELRFPVEDDSFMTYLMSYYW